MDPPCPRHCTAWWRGEPQRTRAARLTPKHPLTLSSGEATRVTRGQGESPGTGGDAGREVAESRAGRAGWAQAAGTDSSVLPAAPPAPWEGGGELPVPPAERQGWEQFLHSSTPSTGGDQAPPNHPGCLVGLVLLETGCGAETSLSSMDAGGASPSVCW